MEFGDLCQLPDERVDLVVGALLIARDAYPRLDVARQVARIAELVPPGMGEAARGRSAVEQAEWMGEHLYRRCGFRGNDQDYYDPRNSYLNDVVERRLGIPITLGVIYLSAARGAGLRAAGVNFPGHFLIRIDAGKDDVVFVDPFHGGGLLDREALEDLWGRVTGTPGALDARALGPVGARAILMRMLRNLRGVHAARGDFRALLLVLDRILELDPTSHDDRRDRGLLAAKLGAPRAALSDLQGYLRAAPESGDVAEVRRLVQELERRGDVPN